jgi:cytoskeletal protein RodZ
MMIQATGEAAKGVITGLSQQPIVLALVVISLMLSGLLYYQAHMFSSQRQANVQMFVEVQKEVQKLLSSCIVPAPRQ